MRALVTEMRRREMPIATVAEVVRGACGGRWDLRRATTRAVEVWPVDTAVGVRAGQLLGGAKAGSELAVDAFVVAVADLAGGAVRAQGLAVVWPSG